MASLFISPFAAPSYQPHPNSLSLSLSPILTQSFTTACVKMNEAGTIFVDLCFLYYDSAPCIDLLSFFTAILYRGRISI